MASGYNSINIYAPASPSAYPYTFTIAFNEVSTDKVNNTSSIAITGTMYAKDIRWSGTTNTLAIYWVDNNVNTTAKLLKSLDISTFVKNNTYTLNDTINVTHKSNGSLNGYALLVFTKNHTNNYAPNTTELSTGSTALTTIPRESSMSFGVGYIEETLSISINRNSDSFTHKISYIFGNLSGVIATGVGNSYNWSIPDTFYSQIPNSKYGYGILYLETYSGNTKIGDTKSYQITIYCVESKCIPDLAGTIKDINSSTIALTESNNVLVDYKSVAEINLTYLAKNSSTISKIFINGVQQILGTKYSLVPNNDTYTIKIEDTRGYSKELVFQSSDSSKSNYFKRINYINLSISAITKRPSQTGSNIQVDLSGSYFNGAFSSSVDNSLNITWKCREKGTSDWTTGETTITTVIENNSYSVSDLNLENPLSTDGEWNYQKIYEFSFTATDKLMDIEALDVRPKGQTNFAIFKDGIMLGSSFISNSTIKGDVLYESGGSKDSFTLTKSAEGYKYLEVFFFADGIHQIVKYEYTTGRNFSTPLIYVDENTHKLYIYVSSWNINGKTATRLSSRNNYLSPENTVVSYGNHAYVMIYKIIGYK